MLDDNQEQKSFSSDDSNTMEIKVGQDYKITINEEANPEDIANIKQKMESITEDSLVTIPKGVTIKPQNKLVDVLNGDE